MGDSKYIMPCRGGGGGGRYLVGGGAMLEASLS